MAVKRLTLDVLDDDGGLDLQLMPSAFACDRVAMLKLEEERGHLARSAVCVMIPSPQNRPYLYPSSPI